MFIVKKQEYVVGFMIHDGHVALVTKARPRWQKGRLNGVGGHIDPTDEDSWQAMAREWLEETGTEYLDWEQFATHYYEDGIVHYFVGSCDEKLVFSSPTDEPVAWYSLQNVLFRHDINPNLKFLIPCARNMDESTILRKSIES